MKYYRRVNAKIPFYLKLISIYSYDKNELEISLIKTIKFFVLRFWFWFPCFLLNYQSEDCINYFPDYINPLTKIPLSGNKVKPFFGLVVYLEEGKYLEKNWIKNIRNFKKFKHESINNNT